MSNDRGGICIWAASYPGNVPSVRSGVTSSLLSRGTVTRWTLVDFLRSSDLEQISALSWSPDGRYPHELYTHTYTHTQIYIIIFSVAL